jgi:glycosyltransferase involved in cell wall biosynthesis
VKILLVEPFFSGSHKGWAEGYQIHSNHQVEILSLPGRFWKWRMHGGAVTLAKRFHKLSYHPDIILTTDMLNLPVFLSLVKPSCPVVVYFHENQFTYPWSPQDEDVVLQRDKHYGFINYSTALCADHVFFNSKFHLNSFFTGLEDFLRQFPDYREIQNIEKIQQKSSVLHLGLNLKKFDDFRKESNAGVPPLILWNHRWEHDKNPEVFFKTLIQLSKRGIDFRLAVLGEEFQKELPCFTHARKQLQKHIVQFGYTESFQEYAQWLWEADFLPVTSNQDFFGASIMEAVYCNTVPLLPERLTYPELFNKKDNPQLYYKNEMELINKLEDLLIKTSRDMKNNLPKIANQYDWDYQAKFYDKTLSELV